MGAAAKVDGAVDKKKAAGGGEKKKDVNGPDSPPPGSVEVVFQIDLHCAGCAKKVRRAVAGFQGVESTGIEMVPPDSRTGLLTVTGQLDPGKLRNLIEAKLHKKIKLVRFVPNGPPISASPPPPDAAAPVDAKKPQPPPQGADGTREIKTKASPAAGEEKHGGGDEKPKAAKQEATDDKPKQEAADEKPQPKAPAPPVASTVVIRMRLHCDDCIVKLKKKIFKLKGVESVEADAIKELVTVKGTMDPAAVPAFIKEKTSRSVDVVSSPANKGGSDGEKNKGGDGDGTGEKNKGADKSNAKQEIPHQPPTATANKMEYRGLTGEVAYAQPAPQAFAYGSAPSPYSSPYASYASPPLPQHQYAYAYPGPDQAGPSSSYASVAYPPYGGSGGAGYYSGGSQMPPPGMAGGYYPGGNGYFEQAPQMFSDENPNGCSVM